MRNFLTILISMSLLFIANLSFSATVAENSTVISTPKEASTSSLLQKKTNTPKKQILNIWDDIKSISLADVFNAKPEEGAKMDGMAVAGFVCGVVSIFVAGLILGALGIIFSAIAMGRISKSEGKKRGKGLAIAGLVCGIVGLVGAAIILSNM